MTFESRSETPTPGYSLPQIGLHWIIAALVIAQLFIGESMTELVEAAEEGEPISGSTSTFATTHYYFGIAILALVAIRLALRLTNGAPPPPATGQTLETLGRVSHWLFYALLVVVPITGLLGYYLGDPYGEIHTFAKPVFIGLIALHVVAVLYHQFWRKDDVLMRMLKPD
ncbi:cytochrome b [Rhodobacter sp. NTK016B]|uniref:cytochrome b n=1 Tax=Rhodobacter sp. NTK016B TaxID=2759676 RepID=UPI001A907E4C|nr:cytochrome b [Rhodobacter sp. NTK016B]MBN8291300.1 cytochrome b [Rhodobacter sp. NTK016B]